jgi:hypothetical protein
MMKNSMREMLESNAANTLQRQHKQTYWEYKDPLVNKIQIYSRAAYTN